VSRPKKDIASRVFPALAFGTLKEVDEFISPGVAAEGNRQAPRHERWWVDSTPFDNLTKAREFVINELQIPITDEIRTEFDYEPAAGWKKKPQTKGTAMPRAIQSAEQAQAKLATANELVSRLSMKEHFKELSAEEQAAHQRELSLAKKRVATAELAVRAAAAGMSVEAYRTQHRRSVRPVIEKRPAANSEAILAAKANLDQAEKDTDRHVEHLSPVGQASHPRRSETRERELRRLAASELRRLATEHSGFEVSITTAGGSNMSIKCVDDRALDSVFLMVKKHGI
jgi:hypothetical protein